MKRRDFLKGVTAGIIGSAVLPRNAMAKFVKVPPCMQGICNLSTQATVNSYNEADLLAFFDRNVGYETNTWIKYYGEEADSILKEARNEFKNLIPDIPYIGVDLPETLLHTYILLAKYIVQKRFGTTLVKIAHIQHEAIETVLYRIPWSFRFETGRLSFTKENIENRKKRCEESQKQIYPENWVSFFVEGDGKTFDYGVDFTECLAIKCFPNHDAEELVPFICPFDDITSRAYGTGLVRTKLLAWGDEKCDFRYKRELPYWQWD